MKCNFKQNKAKLHSVDKGREGILLNKSMNAKLLSPLVLMLNIGLLTFTFMSCLTNKVQRSKSRGVPKTFAFQATVLVVVVIPGYS